MLGLSVGDSIQLAIAAITAIAAGAAVASVFLTVRNEQRRTQPIVVAHEATPRQFAKGAEAFWYVTAYLTSEGEGAAYNVRFGVEFNGVRFPYRLDVHDPEPGNVQRVLRAGERRPPKGAWTILLDDSGQPDDLDAKRAYWARYENARGQTWQTRNPGDRSARLDIRRVHFLKAQEWREQRRRKKAGKHGEAWWAARLNELRDGMKNSDHS